jgi:hypothetical protein
MTTYNYLGFLDSKKLNLYFSRRNAEEKKYFLGRSMTEKLEEKNQKNRKNGKV